MTTEDDFQMGLDLEMNNHQLRLVFADWLEERNDPRAAGYRAMGQLRLCPAWHTYWGYSYWVTKDTYDEQGIIDRDWWLKYEQDQHKKSTRRSAEDALAIAFARLPVYRQQELLKQPVLC